MKDLLTRPPKLQTSGSYDPLELDKWFQNIYLLLGRVTRQFETLANDATPSVNGGRFFLSGGTTTITDFDDGATGQLITLVAAHSLTITDGTNIYLSGSANFTMNATDTLTLICKADNKWYEISRSDNT